MPIHMQVKHAGELPMDQTGLGRSLRRERAMVEIGLNAAILGVRDNEPKVLVVRPQGEPRAGADALPSGPFAPVEHRTLESGLRSWVAEQTGLDLGYVEQLYTYGDRGRHAQPADTAPHVVSIGYLALTRLHEETDALRGAWRSWYEFFPWEDFRNGEPAVLQEVIVPQLRAWAEHPRPNVSSNRPIVRAERVRMCFGLDGATWDEEKVLERYELLYEAGLVDEARRDGRDVPATHDAAPMARLGTPMRFDHRRIFATAIGRIRAKIKWRPVVFELMPDEFTLFELQRTVEAILGPHLHKQNFRRLVETAGLVEPTGVVRTNTGGRPAKLFRFRREVLLERPSPGVRVKTGRA
jgi:hypothetical protein